MIDDREKLIEAIFWRRGQQQRLRSLKQELRQDLPRPTFRAVAVQHGNRARVRS